MGARGPLVLLIVLQGLDILLHVATDQVEPIRIASNVIIGSGAVLALPGPLSRATSLILVSGGIHLVLNLVFLAQYGLVNPTSGGVRLPLFGFVIASLALLAWFWRRLTTPERLRGRGDEDQDRALPGTGTVLNAARK